MTESTMMTDTPATTTPPAKAMPAKGKRYSAEEQSAICAYAEAHGVPAAALQFAVSLQTIYRWLRGTPARRGSAMASASRHPLAEALAQYETAKARLKAAKTEHEAAEARVATVMRDVTGQEIEVSALNL